MKRLLFLLAVMLVLFSLGSCTSKDTSADNNDKQANSDNSSMQTDVEIKIVPPTGWEAVEGSVLPVQYMKNTASFMVKQEAFDAESLDETVKQAKESFDSAFEGVQYIGDAENIKISGNDARKILFTCTVSSMEMKYEYVYLTAGGKIYVITFGDLADSFDTLSDDYEQILKDIKFE